jgi:CBS domain-containing protein
MKRILVADIMTRNPITVEPKTNLLECAKKMVKARVGSLLIADKKRLVGIISRSDILWAIIKKSKEDLTGLKAIDISPKKIATIKPSNTIEEAMMKMKKVKFKKLPVIHEKKLEGLITIRDILNFNPALYPELDELEKIRELSKKLKRVKKTQDILEGICEECGAHDILHRFNGMLLCENCRDSK